MAAELDLLEGEVVESEVKGDYWEKLFLFMHSQKTGKYWFTNKRIIFRGGFATELIIPYQDITEIKKSFVGPFIPTGINVTTKDNKTYKLSLLQRKKYMDFIEAHK